MPADIGFERHSLEPNQRKDDRNRECEKSDIVSDLYAADSAALVDPNTK
jgi:hypothetical protein